MITVRGFLGGVLTFVAVSLPTVGEEQDEISSIPFDTVPTGTSLVSGDSIDLMGNTAVAGSLAISGEVMASSGVRFGDGSLQTTASCDSASCGSLTANAGLYSNRIVEMSPPQAYTEVCFKSGGSSFDIHAAGESTVGGNCMPGEVGWIIERFERDSGEARDWTTARAICLGDGMRLPEPFEIQFVCDSADVMAVSDLVDDSEWATNQTTPILTDGGSLGAMATTLPGGSCNALSLEWVGRNPSLREAASFRCVR